MKDTYYRFTNLADIQEKYYDSFNGDAALYFPKGLRLVTLKLPVGRVVKYRNWVQVISSIAFQTRYLNPDMMKQELQEFLIHIFSQFVVIGKHSSAEKELQIIEDITDKIFATAIEEIKPTYNKKIKYLYNPDYELSSTDKRVISCEMKATRERESKTKLPIEEVLEKWDAAKISYQKIADAIGEPKATIMRHIKRDENLYNLYSELKTA